MSPGTGEPEPVVSAFVSRGQTMLSGKSASTPENLGRAVNTQGSLMNVKEHTVVCSSHWVQLSSITKTSLGGIYIDMGEMPVL